MHFFGSEASVYLAYLVDGVVVDAVSVGRRVAVHGRGRAVGVPQVACAPVVPHSHHGDRGLPKIEAANVFPVSKWISSVQLPGHYSAG